MSQIDDRSTPNTSVIFKGLLGEMLAIDYPDGRHFEKFRRPPGTRLVIVSSEGKILVTNEERLETKGIDRRLPGGKVCDSLDDYHDLLASGKSMLEAAREGAIKEALEETGLEIKNPELITISNAGATVEWDLYYFICREYTATEKGQRLEVGENIEVTWMSPDEIRKAILKGQMQEWRTAGVLLGLVLPQLET